MTPSKRALDLFICVLLFLVLWPAMIVIALVILVRDGRPVFYLSERMQTPDRALLLLKYRTMRPDPNDAGVSGGDKADRITPTGRFLRRYRLDELPQLWNVARGDISFVGPRPPLRRYVEMAPDLYAEVLRCRPGITGLATLVYHRREETLLAACRTPEQTEDVYLRRCVPRKARLDLIYRRNRSICYDLWLMWATIFRRTRRRTGHE